jgi:riboflavin synthase
MFTGIIRHVGTVRRVRQAAGGKRLTIDVGPLAEGLGLGDSLAVDGACLTACRVAAGEADFDAVAETLSRTTLGDLRAGTRVNLERPCRVSDVLDGHIVQGHVDGTAAVRRIDRAGGQWAVELAAARELTDEMVPRGSVALAGVSLTLTHVGEGVFGVALIPTTLGETTLADLDVAATVNVETDMIGKYVRRYLRQLGGGGPHARGGLTIEKLREAGFG